MSKTDDMRKAREASQPKRVRVPEPDDGTEGSAFRPVHWESGVGLVSEDPTGEPVLHSSQVEFVDDHTVRVRPDHITDPATTETVLRAATRKHRKPKPVGTQHLGVRCSPDELERWQARADAEGRSLSNWARRMLNNG